MLLLLFEVFNPAPSLPKVQNDRIWYVLFAPRPPLFHIFLPEWTQICGTRRWPWCSRIRTCTSTLTSHCQVGLNIQRWRNGLGKASMKKRCPHAKGGGHPPPFHNKKNEEEKICSLKGFNFFLDFNSQYHFF